MKDRVLIGLSALVLFASIESGARAEEVVAVVSAKSPVTALSTSRQLRGRYLPSRFAHKNGRPARSPAFSKNIAGRLRQLA